MNHAIIAPIILPAVVAAIIIGLARHNLQAQRLIAVIANFALVVVAMLLLYQASALPPQAYHLGNWPAPFGIVLILDRLAALMLVLVAGLSFGVLIYVIATGWDARGRHFHVLLLFQIMGLNGAFLTGDAFNLFVFFEVLLIASYGLMIHGGGADRLRAGVQYVAFNLLGSTLFLFALATIYAVTGTLNMADLATKVAILPSGDAALVRVAAVLLMLVFAIKAALVPFQFWLPGTYANAPGPIAALFAVMTKVGAYAAIRFGTLVFPTGTAATGTLIGDLLYPAAIFTMAFGAFGVLGSQNLARLVAFAGIGSMGLVFLAIAAFTPQATAAALYYMLHSTLATAVLFLLADQLKPHAPTADHESTPVPARSGAIAALFLVAAVAMIGMPPLSGFIGKLLILDALRDSAAVAWTASLSASFLSMIGFARTGSALFWRPDDHTAAADQHPLALVSIAAGLIAITALSLFAEPVLGWLTQTATDLHNPAAYIAAHALQRGV